MLLWSTAESWKGKIPVNQYLEYKYTKDVEALYTTAILWVAITIGLPRL